MDDEATYRATLEQRATNVVTSSGTLVSLLFAFTAFAKGSDKLVLPGISKVTLIIALIGFVLAVMIALVYVGLIVNRLVAINLNALHEVLSSERFRSLDAVTLSLEVASTQLDILEMTRRLNQGRARFVAVAVGMEVVAVLFLGISIVGILITY